MGTEFLHVLYRGLTASPFIPSMAEPVPAAKPAPSMAEPVLAAKPAPDSERAAPHPKGGVWAPAVRSSHKGGGP